MPSVATTLRLPRAFESRFGLLVHKLGNHLLIEATDGFEQLGLDPRDYVTLAVLADDRPASQQELAEMLGLVPGGVVALLDGLQERGLVQRRRSTEDRRRTVVELTPAGVARLADADAEVARIEEEFFGVLSADERQSLHDLIRRVMAASWRPC